MQTPRQLVDLETHLNAGPASSKELVHIAARAQFFAAHFPKHVIPIVSALFAKSKALNSTPSVTDDSTAAALFRLGAAACGAREEVPTARERALAFGAPGRSKVGGLVGAFLSDKEAEAVVGADEELVLGELADVRKILASSAPECRESLACAHLIQTALSACKRKVAPQVRMAAADFLCAAVDAFPPNVVAGFLPGVASTYGSFLASCRIDQSGFAIALLRGFVLLVKRSMDAVQDSKYDPGPASSDMRGQEPFADLVARLQSASNRSGAKQDPISDRAETKSGNMPGTREWAAVASVRVAKIVALILQSRDGLAKHSGAWTRHALASACAMLLDIRHFEVSVSTRALLIDTLAVLRSDVCEDVAKGSCAQLRRLLLAKKVDVQMLREGIGRIHSLSESLAFTVQPAPLGHPLETVDGSASVPSPTDVGPVASSNGMPDGGASHSVDEKITDITPDEEWLCKLHGFVQTLEEHSSLLVVRPSFSSGVSREERQDCLDPSPSALAETIAYFDPAAVADVLVAAFELAGIQTSFMADIEGSQGSTPSQRRACNIAASLGTSGCLPLLYAHVLQQCSADPSLSEEEKCEESSLLSQRCAIAALEIMICACIGLDGAKSGETIANSRMNLAIQDAAIDCSMELLRVLAMYRIHTDAATEAVNAIAPPRLVEAKVACLQGISNVFSALGLRSRVAPRYVLAVIVDILRDMAVGDPQVREAARVTMNQIASVMMRNSGLTASHLSQSPLESAVPWRQLVEGHVNYVVSRLVCDLGRHWTGPVLGLMVGDYRDSLCEKSVALVEATMNLECDELSGSSNHRALGALSAIHGVLCASDPAQIRLTCFGPPSRSNISVDDIRKSIVAFCLEEVPDPGGGAGSIFGRESDESSNNSSPRTTMEKDAGLGEDPEIPKDPFANLASKAIAGCCDLLVGRPTNVRAAALRCAASAVQLLADDQDTLLPHVASLLLLLPGQFVRPLSSGAAELRRQTRLKRRRGLDSLVVRAISVIESINELGGALPVITAGSRLLTVLVQCAGDFIRDRFVRLIFPSLEPLLELANIYPQLDSFHFRDELVPLPSDAAEVAVDAAMEAVAAIARELPHALKPFSRRLVDLLFPYLTNSPKRRTTGMSDGRQQIEAERWLARSGYANRIIEGLSRHSGDEMWFFLLQRDTSGPETLSSPSPVLENLRIRQ